LKNRAILGAMTVARSEPHRHAAKFYESEKSLYQTAANFLSDGLIASRPAVVIATPLHTGAIEHYLRARWIDVSRAKQHGDLICLDAEDTLGTFMIGGHPDAELFHVNVGSVLEQARRGRRGAPIRAYGEMVDVLWRQGRADAAIELEILWNELALKHAFSLLCGYAMGNFFTRAEQFHEVCRQHTHVFDPATNRVTFNQRAAGYS
jgi:hypothetical protein